MGGLNLGLRRHVRTHASMCIHAYIHSHTILIALLICFVTVDSQCNSFQIVTQTQRCVPCTIHSAVFIWPFGMGCAKGPNPRS